MSENVKIPRIFLLDLEVKLDELNAEFGTEKRLCVFCNAEGYTSEKGLLHEDNCPIEQLRKWTRGRFMRK